MTNLALAFWISLVLTPVLTGGMIWNYEKMDLLNQDIHFKLHPILFLLSVAGVIVCLFTGLCLLIS